MKPKEKVLSALETRLDSRRDVPVTQCVSDNRVFEAHPKKAPVDLDALQDSVAVRYSKILENLAK